jgi:predicted HicB family RNase H-like nuclease
MRKIRIEYEIPPLRAVYTEDFVTLSDTIDKEKVAQQLIKENPRARVRKVTELCEKCDNHATEPHTCLYLLEIDEDNSLCNCCEACEDQCRDRI